MSENRIPWREAVPGLLGLFSIPAIMVLLTLIFAWVAIRLVGETQELAVYLLVFIQAAGVMFGCYKASRKWTSDRAKHWLEFALWPLGLVTLGATVWLVVGIWDAIAGHLGYDPRTLFVLLAVPLFVICAVWAIVVHIVEVVRK